MKRISVITISALLLIQGGALAHEGEKHEQKTHKTDAQMQKLHGMMPTYGAALAKVEQALEKKDAAAVEAEAGRMLATTPDLKKSKPHKNIKQLKTFRSIAAGFEGDLKETVDQAKKGDFAKAGAAFKKAEAKCAQCHAKFR
ncbi:MAG: cytochrome c [Geobacter sp.]|nr:cytochrome c [Geobacter sp.]